MKELQTTSQNFSVQDIMTVSETFFKSGMFKDCTSAAQAMVKIMAGAEISIPAFQAMSGIHIIQGKPTIGAGLMASKVKGSGKYDYRVIEQTEKVCTIDFYQGKEKIGTSSFTIEQAKAAGTQNLAKFPANMLFARAISNGVKWYCPDVFTGPVYVPEEMGGLDTEDISHEEINPQASLPAFIDDNFKSVPIGSKAFNSAVKAMKEGKSFEDVEATANNSKLSFQNEDVKSALLDAVETAA